MAERNFTDGDIKALGKEIASAIGKGSGPGSGGGGGADKVSVPKESLSAFDSAMKGAGKAVDATKDAYNKVSPSLKEGLDTWRDLSKAGAGFSNDIVGMTAAAKGSRLPLGEFASVIKDNAASLSGFGGNVTRGAEEFSRLSKKMFDDYAPNTDQLIQMGIANKDLNELLMIQSVSTRAKMKDGDEKDRKLIENAMALGTEMDLMAKLTGKSREAQMEQQRKNQQDMAFEAAIRRKTIGMSADDAMEFEKNARNQLRDAQMRGQEAVFKDVFATGNIVSKEAAMQAAVNQEQAAATTKQAQVSADKAMEAKERERQANAAGLEGRRAFDKDMQNDTKLMYASLGENGGAVGKAVRDSMTSQIEYQRNFEATSTKMFGENAKLTEDQKVQVQKRMDEEAKAAAAGKKGDGTQGDASTKALVNLGARAGDVESAFMNKIVKPLNEKVNPAFDKLAEGALGATKKGATETRVNAAERELDEGAKGKTTTALNKLAGANEAIGDTTNKLVGVNNPPKPIPKKALGGPVEEGEPYIVGDGGEEEIFVPKTAGEIIPKSMLGPKGLGSRSENMEGAYKSMQSMDPAKMFAELKAKTAGGGINFNEISKDISTTVSGGGSSTVKVPDMAEMTKKFETSFADFDKAATKNIKLDDLTSSFKTSFNNFNTDTAKNIKLDDLTSSFKTSFNNFNTDTAKNIKLDNLTSSFENSFKDFDGVATKNIKFDNLTSSFKTSFDDFGSEISKYADLDDLMTPFEESFSSFNNDFENMIVSSSEDIADAVGGSKSKIAQDKIDAAIEEKKKASDTLAFMLNNIADEDWDDETQAAWDEAIDRRDAAKEKLDKVIEESISDLAGGFDDFSNGWSESVDKVSADISDAIPYDEFGDLDGAIAKQQADSQEGKLLSSETSGNAMNDVVAGSSPTATQGRGITADSITIGPNGMPVAKPKSTAAAVPDKPAEKKASPGKAINPETGEEYTPLSELEKQAGATKAAPPKPAGSTDKAATLDDVVKSLNALNTKMGQLIDVNDAGHKASAKAAKSGSANLYNK